MRKCEDCDIILEDDVRYCPNCGKCVDISSAQSNDIELLLENSRASLALQKWDDALADAAEAMRIDPSNAESVTLIAEIYEEQGKLDESAIWYKTAIKLDPSNSNNIARLGLLNQRRALDSSVSANPQKQQDKGVKFVLAICGALVILIVVLAFILSSTSKRNAQEKIREITSTSSVPQTKLDQDSGLQNGTNNTGNTQSGTNSSSTTNKPDPHTAGELAIKQGLTDSKNLQTSGITINDVIADPRQSLAIVTYTIQANASLNKNSVLITSAAIAQTAFASHEEIKFVTVRCIISSGSSSSSTQIAFVGDISRDAVNTLGQNPNQEKLQSSFSNSWWNPQIK